MRRSVGMLLLLLPAIAAGIAASPARASCVAGRWIAPPDLARANADDPARPVRFETAHLAFRRAGDATTRADAEAAGACLEYVWGEFIGRPGFPEPDCASTARTKANIVIDPGFGLTGGVDEQGRIGMWIGPADCATASGWRMS